MKKEVLLELAEKWEREAREPKITNAHPDHEMDNIKAAVRRETKRECADTLRMLVQLLG